ncbi:MAG TPA: DMT family transporter, partial [Candidatus Angelobacter sp.]
VHVPDRRDWPRVVLCGVLGFAIYALLVNYGEMHVTAGIASFVVYTVPLFTAIFASLFLRERLGIFGWTGLAVSLAGTALLAFSTNQQLRFEPGVITLLAAAVALALYFILQKPLVKRYGAFNVTSWAVWISTACLAPLIPQALKAAHMAPLASTMSAVYLGVFPTVVAYSTWAFAVARLPVARTAACLYFVPGVATFIGWLLLGEHPTPLGLVGGLVAMGGVAFSNLSPKGR